MKKRQCIIKAACFDHQLFTLGCALRPFCVASQTEKTQFRISWAFSVIACCDEYIGGEGGRETKEDVGFIVVVD